MNSQLQNSPEIDEPESIWNPYATVNWSVLFTPAFGSWLQMQNWLSLGEPELAALSKRWFYGSLAVIFLSASVSVLFPGTESSPMSGGYLLGAYLLVWYIVSARAQAKYVKEKFGEDYNRLPWKKPILAAIGFGVLYIVLNVIVGIILGTTSAA